VKPLVVEIPMRLSNPLNGSHGHWAVEARLRKQQRSSVGIIMAAQLASARIMPPCRVTVTRIAPRALDRHDGLPASAKAVVDGVADAMGIRDDDTRVEWRIEQRKGKPREYACEIRVEAIS